MQRGLHSLVQTASRRVTEMALIGDDPRMTHLQAVKQIFAVIAELIGRVMYGMRITKG